jgi:hypothetical protein
MEDHDRYYHDLSTAELLRRVSDSPPDTPDWIKANAELTRRSETQDSALRSMVPRERDIADPLSDVTRRERRSLLLVDAVLLAIVLGNLVPTQVEALGITVSKTERNAVLVLLAGVALYLLMGFVIYALADLKAWKADVAIFIQDRARSLLARRVASPELEDANPNFVRTARKVAEEQHIEEWPTTRKIYGVRRLFEFWVPILVTIAAIAVTAIRVVADLS